jgi:hypothetical protein
MIRSGCRVFEGIMLDQQDQGMIGTWLAASSVHRVINKREAFA